MNTISPLPVLNPLQSLSTEESQVGKFENSPLELLRSLFTPNVEIPPYQPTLTPIGDSLAPSNNIQPMETPTVNALREANPEAIPEFLPQRTPEFTLDATPPAVSLTEKEVQERMAWVDSRVAKMKMPQSQQATRAYVGNDLVKQGADFTLVSEWVAKGNAGVLNTYKAQTARKGVEGRGIGTTRESNASKAQLHNANRLSDAILSASREDYTKKERLSDLGLVEIPDPDKGIGKEFTKFIHHDLGWYAVATSEIRGRGAERLPSVDPEIVDLRAGAGGGSLNIPNPTGGGQATKINPYQQIADKIKKELSDNIKINNPNLMR